MPSGPTDPEPVRMRAGSTEVGVTVEGPDDAFPWLLLHGYPGGRRDFRYLAPLLASRFRTVRVELPGFGAVRDAPWSDYSPEGRASLVVAAADALGLDRFCLSAHSVGGPAALTTAADHPDRVAALALISSVGLRRHRSMALPPSAAARVRALARVPLVRTWVLRRMRRAYRRVGFSNADRLTLHDLRLHCSHVADLDFEAVRDAARRVRCPTLVAWAADDPQIEPEIHRELAAAIPGAERAEYEAGGHQIQKHQAADLFRRMQVLTEAIGG